MSGIMNIPPDDEDEPVGEIKPEHHQKSYQDIRQRMGVEVSTDRTYVVVLAIHADPSKNVLTRISCREGIAISGYLHDLQADTYYVECHDYVPIGYVPVSFYQTMPGVGNWKQRIPMPEIVLRRYMTTQQRHDLRQFKATYKRGQYSFHFMQTIDCFRS